MADCCSHKSCELETLREKQSATLKTVLIINATMFLVEITAGLLSGSVSLLADSLDMLGDALVYGFSLYAVARGLHMKARAAVFKGGIMAAFGVFVLGQALYKTMVPQLPVAEAIGGIGLLALVANSFCFFLLWRHKQDDINMSSVWLCSRNDIITNISVLIAAYAVWLSQSSWPDIVLGFGIAALFLHSALLVLYTALQQLKQPDAPE